MPAWRMAPPKRCFRSQACSMTSAGPASTAPVGAPSPLVKSTQMVSTGAAQAEASTPDATTAVIRREPSVCTATPCVWAGSATASSGARGQTVPPAKLWVCSRHTSRVGGTYWLPGVSTGASCPGVKKPRSPRIVSITHPFTAAAPDVSERSTWPLCSSTIESPGRVWAPTATRLHIVPVGKKIARSLPSSSAIRSCSRLTVGSALRCSSPTSAPAIAARIASVGRVWVSENRLMERPVTGAACQAPRSGGEGGEPHPHGGRVGHLAVLGGVDPVDDDAGHGLGRRRELEAALEGTGRRGAAPGDDALAERLGVALRSEERRVGEGCGSTCKARGSPYN